ncbi:MAG TPA: hypothetical protein PLA41_02920 [Candidatus Pacearchaeota archaeon]|nr:hypothetical protein [Candidatus Parcubacteria bacterium]HNZ84178.1 hypothetical protein [Candidatus Pacearchaeota archaeon]HOU46074.1 hypothetical protein [Candidatus Pacearchaeota archaeon]HPM08617.1 hypothetical protein [Candidatus Pacearchaeota archaeon]HQI74787.1 hypothetical protein [Candidatus Pacearchaeota archaeon]
MAIQAPENISEKIKKFISSVSEKETEILVKICEYFELFNLEKFPKELWQNYTICYMQVIWNVRILDKEAKERLVKGMYATLGGSEIARELADDMGRRMFYFSEKKVWPEHDPAELKKLFCLK